ncbi:MAG: hypothetical protein HYV16_16225 [Gammaproteobacteria bacterium]|nr:hypothetical protein [Gammaproteobacteria bacterium]
MEVRSQHPLQKASDALLATMVVCLLLAPLSMQILALVKKRLVVSEEQRALAAWPAAPGDWTSWREFPRKVDSYLSDHFGFRNELIKFRNFAFVKFGVSASKKVLIGRDGWFFYLGDKALEQSVGKTVFDHVQLQELVARYIRFNDALSSRGIKLLYALAPNSQSVYPEYLPSWVEKNAKVVQRAQFSDALPASLRYSFLDLLPALLQAKSLGRLYHKTDSHWNELGAFVAYQAIMRELFSNQFSVSALNYKDIRMLKGDGAAGDLARLLNLSDKLHEEHYGIGVSSSKLIEQREIAVPGGAPILYYRSNAKGPKVMIVRDSFGFAPARFFAESLSECIVVPVSSFSPELLDKYQPVVVLGLMVERNLPKLFLPELPSH